jgi:N-acetylglucosamine kinase-like BadF-type ATPase
MGFNVIVLGVDAGGSKTFAVAADERGRVLGFGRGGCGNYEGFGLEAAMAEIRRACRGALDAAGTERAQVGCFGLAGADFPEDFEMLRVAVCKLAAADDVHIYNDTRVAFEAGSRRGCGAVVIMGSGMNAAGFAPVPAAGGRPRDCRLPGEGYLYGDWGGAGTIGPEIMHRVMRAHDGRGEPTALAAMVLERLGARDVDELTRRLYRDEIPPRAIAALTTLVFPAALGGDKVAREIIERIADETARAALAMLRRLGLEQTECDVVLGGGVYKGEGPLLLDLVRAKIHAGAPYAEIIVPLMEPVMGAAILALEKAGVAMDDRVRANLQQGNDRLVAPDALPGREP